LVAIDPTLIRYERTEARWDMVELLRVKGELVLLANAQSSVNYFSEALDGAGVTNPPFPCELQAARRLSRLWHDRVEQKTRASISRQFLTDSLKAFGTADLRAVNAILDRLEPSPSPERERGPTSQ
jgi:hypothetical protein